MLLFLEMNISLSDDPHEKYLTHSQKCLSLSLTLFYSLPACFIFTLIDPCGLRLVKT